MILAANLIPAPRRVARLARVRVRAWSAGCSALVVALVAGYLSLSSVESGDRARLERAVAVVGRRADRLEREVSEAKARNGDLARRLATTRAMVDHPDWSVLLDLLTGARGRELMLERVTLNASAPPGQPRTPAAGAGPAAESYVVRISGLGASQGDVMNYVAALASTGLFDSVKPPETRRRTVLNRELVGFEIECELAAHPVETHAKPRSTP